MPKTNADKPVAFDADPFSGSDAFSLSNSNVGKYLKLEYIECI